MQRIYQLNEKGFISFLELSRQTAFHKAGHAAAFQFVQQAAIGKASSMLAHFLLHSAETVIGCEQASRHWVNKIRLPTSIGCRFRF